MTARTLVVAEEQVDRETRILRGEIEAFERFFREEFAPLRSFLQWQVGDAAHAEELAQDVFLRLWSGRTRLRDGGSLRAYLYRSARNAAINHRKRALLEVRRAGEVAAAARPRQAATDDAVRVRELAEAVEAAIATLPERCRLVFDLSRRRRLSYAEIAEALGISVKTVEAQIGRALQLLRDRLSAHLT